MKKIIEYQLPELAPKFTLNLPKGSAMIGLEIVDNSVIVALEIEDQNDMEDRYFGFFIAENPLPPHELQYVDRIAMNFPAKIIGGRPLSRMLYFYEYTSSHQPMILDTGAIK